MKMTTKNAIEAEEYIRRRKMTQAAFELQRTDNKVIDVAHKRCV